MLTLSNILMFFDIILNYFIFNKQSVDLQIYQIYTKLGLLTSIEKHIIDKWLSYNEFSLFAKTRSQKCCLKCLNINPMDTVNNILCMERTVHPDPGYG